MGKFVLKNVRLFAGAADLTTVNNQIELSPSLEVEEVTGFTPTGDVWVERLGGLRSVEASAEGQWEAGDPARVDNEAFTNLGVVVPWTVCPAGAAVGELAWLTGMLRTGYELGGSVGSVAPWKASGAGTWPLARGVILHPPGTARTATGSGSAVQLGAVPAGQQLYVALHVHSAAGTTPNLTVTVQTDDTAGFASPTTVATFTVATAQTAQILRVPGPITDTYVRVGYTISGTTPSFQFTASAGIA